MQEPKTIEQVRDVVALCHFPGKGFRVGEYGDGFFIQIEYDEMDVVTSEMAVQRGRKWIVSPFATHSEIVQTCFAACMASAEHQVREHFAYSGPCPKCEGHAVVAKDFGIESEGKPDVVPCPACGSSGRGKPRAIFGPHFHSDVLYGICGKRAHYDARENPE